MDGSIISHQVSTHLVPQAVIEPRWTHFHQVVPDGLVGACSDVAPDVFDEIALFSVGLLGPSAAGLDQILSGAKARAGLEHVTCHRLRHTCFTRLREAGMALEAIQAQAGHASIESTRIYLHLANDWLVGEYSRALNIIDGEAMLS